MFRQIVVSGDAYDRGFAHGDFLHAEIEGAVSFYADVFGLSRPNLSHHVEYFKNKIREVDDAYVAEIEGIAAGAKIDPLWVYALNCRTELMSLTGSRVVNECTALHFKPSALLGQNWDWAERLERFACLLHIEKAGQWMYMFIEPGMIGKIGMNSSGLGVCLNFLSIDRPLAGVPVHIVLRAILDSSSIDEAKRIAQRFGYGKSSSVLIGDGNGSGCTVEFAADDHFLIEHADDVMLHTNHYLSRHINAEEDFQSSYARFRTAQALTTGLQSFTIEGMVGILSDRSNTELPIYRPYTADEDLGSMGTVCTVIMDLANKRFYIRKGTQAGNELALVFDGGGDNAVKPEDCWREPDKSRIA